MPRVHHRKAAKDYPKNGIKKGEMYYTWKLRTSPLGGITYRQKTKPLPEQLTTSGYLQEFYPLEREVQDFSGTPDDLQDLRDAWETLRDQEQEKLDNMPDTLQDSDTGMLIQERVEQCDSFIQQIDEYLNNDEDEFTEEQLEAIRSISA